MTDSQDPVPVRRHRRGRAASTGIVLLVFLVTFATRLWWNVSISGPRPEPTLGLRAPASVNGCPPLIETLRTATIAFAGRVRSVDDSAVVLDVTDRSRGAVPDVVFVDNRRSGGDALPEFRAGQRYLVAATGGALLPCEAVGLATPTRRDAYRVAFGP